MAAFASLFLLHWAVLLTPGVNFVLVSQLAAAQSRRVALWAALGVSGTALLWSSLAALGLHALLLAHAWAAKGLQILGALYLLHVAIKLWHGAAGASSGRDVPALTPWQALRMGFVTNALNPKSALFFGSVFAAALPAGLGATGTLAAVGLMWANSLVWHAALALGFCSASVQRAYARVRAPLQRACAVLLGGLGLRMLWR